MKFLPRSPDHLQFIKLKSLSVKECQDSMSGAMTVADSEICSFTEAGEGACHVSFIGIMIIDLV